MRPSIRLVPAIGASTLSRPSSCPPPGIPVRDAGHGAPALGGGPEQAREVARRQGWTAGRPGVNPAAVLPSHVRAWGTMSAQTLIRWPPSTATRDSTDKGA